MTECTLGQRGKLELVSRELGISLPRMEGLCPDVYTESVAPEQGNNSEYIVVEFRAGNAISERVEIHSDGSLIRFKDCFLDGKSEEEVLPLCKDSRTKIDRGYNDFGKRFATAVAKVEDSVYGYIGLETVLNFVSSTALFDVGLCPTATVFWDVGEIGVGMHGSVCYRIGGGMGGDLSFGAVLAEDADDPNLLAGIVFRSTFMERIGNGNERLQAGISIGIIAQGRWQVGGTLLGFSIGLSNDPLQPFWKNGSWDHVMVSWGFTVGG